MSGSPAPSSCVTRSTTCSGRSRTRGTAGPLAEERRLPVTIYDKPKALAERVRTEHGGDAILVVGHSNTVPKLLEAGHSLVVIEHNLDVGKTADWGIDLGPEGGEGGGRILAAGTPEKISRMDESFTGRYLKSVLTDKNGRSIISGHEPEPDADEGRADARGDPRRSAQDRQQGGP